MKASAVAGPRGFRGAKRVNGVKPHVLVDSGRILVAAVVAPADKQDRTAFPKLPRNANRVAPTIAHLWVDKGYTGSTGVDAAAKSVDVVSGPKPAAGSPSNRAGGWSNAATARSTTADASTATTKSRSTLTKTFRFSAKPRSYPDDSTDPSCWTRLRRIAAVGPPSEPVGTRLWWR